MDDIEQRKLQAEIANLEAESKRALSESAKAEAETRAVGKSGWDWTVEGVKVVGAIVLGIGGFTAAITGYQLSEVKKERMDLQVARGMEQLETLNRQKAEADAAKSATDAAVANAKQQLAAINTEVESLQKSLEMARDARPGNAVLNEAITRTAGIVKSVSSANAQLQVAAQATSSSRPTSDYLVGLQTLGVPDEARQSLNAKLHEAGYSLDEISASYQASAPPAWFAPRSTVLYYSKSALRAAQGLADEMKKLTGQEFAVQRGSGLGVDPSLQDVTLFVHYIKK